MGGESYWWFIPFQKVLNLKRVRPPVFFIGTPSLKTEEYWLVSLLDNRRPKRTWDDCGNRLLRNRIAKRWRCINFIIYFRCYRSSIFITRCRIRLESIFDWKRSKHCHKRYKLWARKTAESSCKNGWEDRLFSN